MTIAVCVYAPPPALICWPAPLVRSNQTQATDPIDRSISEGEALTTTPILSFPNNRQDQGQGAPGEEQDGARQAARGAQEGALRGALFKIFKTGWRVCAVYGGIGWVGGSVGEVGSGGRE